MNIIFKIISFPITVAIGLLSGIILLIINYDLIEKVNQNKLTKKQAMNCMSEDFNHFILNELWIGIYPFFRACIAVGIYYYFFF